MRDGTSNMSTDLEVVNEEKDLDVWSSYDLKPSVHCQRAAAKASQVLCLSRGSFQINSAEMFVFMYKMCVWPHLEYRVQTWSLYLAKDIDLHLRKYRGVLLNVYMDLLISIRRTTCFIPYFVDKRQRGDRIETYKIINGYYDIDASTIFILSNLS